MFASLLHSQVNLCMLTVMYLLVYDFSFNLVERKQPVLSDLSAARTTTP